MGPISPSQPISTDPRTAQDEQSIPLPTDEKIHQIRVPSQGAGALLGSNTAALIPDLSKEKKKRIEVRSLKKSDQ